MASNILTQEQLKERLAYNKDTGVFIWKAPRLKALIGNEAGVIKKTRNGKKYKYISFNNKAYATHRLAWLYMYGEWPKDQIDHIDGNGENNKIGNLRQVSNAENAKNQRIRSTNKSGVTGVNWDKLNNKWKARICVKGKSITLGYFTDKSKAVAVRISANVKYGFHVNHGTNRPL